MRFRWPEDTVFERLVLDVEQESCAWCGRRLRICDHRFHRIFTLEHPLELCCRLVHCSDPACPSRPHTLSPPAELSLTLPGWLLGWDVFCWLGHRRFARHWSVSQLRAELADSYRIPLSADAISLYLRRYQTMLAARQQDPVQLAKAYEHIASLVLTIDGLQPEKGHETLYAVRELNGKRVWFAEALLSSTQDEVRRLLVRAHQLAEQLGKPIRLWISDKQDAFVTGIAAEFPAIPHRYCANHFLRDLAKPLLATDSHAKVQLRKKVRGLRAIEGEVLKQRRAARAETKTTQEVTPAVLTAGVTAGAAEGNALLPPDAAAVAVATALAVAAPETGTATPTPAADDVSQVVLDYCSAVRGILNDDQGGPLEPPGLRMAAALTEVKESLGRNLALHQPGAAHGQLERLAACIERGLAAVQVEQQEVGAQVQAIKRVAQTLKGTAKTRQRRKDRYQALQEKYQQKGGEFGTHLSRVMLSWLAGLFVVVKGKAAAPPTDNLDLERWFRKPKSHERRIHGRKHAGVRIVQEGPTLLLVLNAHEEHTGPFRAEELLPYRQALDPADQREAMRRRKIMRKARSKKKTIHVL